MRTLITVVLAATALAPLAAPAATPAASQDNRDGSPPAVFERLLDCRRIAEPAERLSCYDRQSAEVEEATRKRDLVISDKQTISAARRQLFGFNLRLGSLFGGGRDGAGKDADPEEINEIETTVAGVRRTANGWRLQLADGTTWEQNDTRDFALSPKVGNAVRISKGALGSYLVSVQQQRAIKMRRMD